jgi:hypothetical protein
MAGSMFKLPPPDTAAAALWISELLPHTASVADELCIVRSMHTEAINHEPAITFFRPARSSRPAEHRRVGRYGLGTDNRDLPTFVVLITQGFGNMQALYARASGATASCRASTRAASSAAAAIRCCSCANPAGVCASDRRAMLDLVRASRRPQAHARIPEIEARIAQQEMAFRMQTSVPELIDLATSPRRRGALRRRRSSPARSRQLPAGAAPVERGVRFVQLFTAAGTSTATCRRDARSSARQTTRPIAALLTDLRGAACSTTRWWCGAASSAAPSTARAGSPRQLRPRPPPALLHDVARRRRRARRPRARRDRRVRLQHRRDPVHVHDLHATCCTCSASTTRR